MRREFPTSVRVAVIKRTTDERGFVHCEKCKEQAKKFQIDHVIADGLGGKPVLENAMLICERCYSEKNPQDTTLIAKAKRREAKHIGAKTKSQYGFRRPEKEPVKSRHSELPRRPLYEDIR